VIVVDTHVISELMAGNRIRQCWLGWGATPPPLLYATRINQAEILYGIALAAGASIATRDTDGFPGCGRTVIDPWTASQ